MKSGSKLGTLVLCVAALTSAAHANTIEDPRMELQGDQFSDAITLGFQFSPNATGGGIFGFFNTTGQTITELTFEALLRPGISQADIASAFRCNSGNLNPFFLNCRVDYLEANGRFTIAFWGTNEPSDHLGIQPMPPGCDASNANTDACKGTGHFAVVLNDPFSLTSGGWSNSVNPLLFYPGGPTFTVTEIQTAAGAVPQGIAAVPEPGVFGLVGVALAGIGWFRRPRRSLA